MAKGWIKIHRSLQDCEIWTGMDAFDKRSAWVDLLMLANHKDVNMLFDYKQITIYRGQYLTSVRKLADRWGWSKNRVGKYLDLLERLNMIKRDSNNQRTLLTIVNYTFYQDVQDTDEDTGKDTPIDTDKDTGVPQTRMKECKNENNKKSRRFTPPTIEEVKEYCRERGNTIDPDTFIDFYSSKGWKVGKEGMKDWKAAIRTWEKRNKKTETSSPRPSYKNKPKEQWDSYMWNDAIKDGYATNDDLREWRKEHVII